MRSLNTDKASPRVAISGAGGLIGSRLCESLQDAGYEVWRMVRPASHREATPKVPQIEWSPLEGMKDPTLVNNFDAIIHMAGRSIAAQRWSTLEKDRLRDSRVAATEALVAQLGQLVSPPRTFLSISATGYYGDCGSEMVRETAPAATDFLATLASDWEAVAEPLKRVGVRVVHPRLGMVLAGSGGALAKMLPLFRWFLGGRLGSGDQYWSWIAIDDCVSALQWLLEHPTAEGAYNLVAPNPVTNSQFTGTLAKVMGRPVSLPVPAFLLRLMLGEMADALLLASCRVDSSRLVQAGFAFKFPELAECLHHELG